MKSKMLRFLVFCVLVLPCFGMVRAADVEYKITEGVSNTLVEIEIKDLSPLDFELRPYDYDKICAVTADKRCSMWTRFLKNGGGFHYVGGEYDTKPKITYLEAIKEISAHPIKMYISKGVWEKIIADRPICMEFQLWFSMPLAAPGPSTCNGGLPPLPVPDPISCTMSDIDLQHGTINLSDVNGHQAAKSAYISCNGNGSGRVTVNVSAINNGQITLDNTGHLRSQIYINGVAGGQNMSIPNNGASLSVMSKLTADAGFEFNGRFQKSSVIILSIL